MEKARVSEERAPASSQISEGSKPKAQEETKKETGKESDLEDMELVASKLPAKPQAQSSGYTGKEMMGSAANVVETPEKPDIRVSSLEEQNEPSSGIGLRRG